MLVAEHDNYPPQPNAHFREIAGDDTAMQEILTSGTLENALIKLAGRSAVEATEEYLRQERTGES